MSATPDPLARAPQRIVSVGDTAGGGIAMTVLGVSVLLLGLAVAVGVQLAGDGLGGWVFFLAMGPVGAVFIKLSSRSIAVARRFEPGVLETDREAWTLGAAGTGRFRRVVRRGSTDLRSISGYLLLEEWVRWQQGTDTRTATHEVHRYPVDLTHRIDPQAVVADVMWRFPTYPPSHKSSNNEVRWRLVVDVEMADGFVEDSVVPLWVVPGILAADEDGVEDTR